METNIIAVRATHVRAMVTRNTFRPSPRSFPFDSCSTVSNDCRMDCPISILQYSLIPYNEWKIGSH